MLGDHMTTVNGEKLVAEGLRGCGVTDDFAPIAMLGDTASTGSIVVAQFDHTPIA